MKENFFTLFYATKRDQIRNVLVGLVGCAVGDFLFGHKAILSSGFLYYSFSSLWGPSLKSQREFLKKYVSLDKLDHLNLKPPLFRKNAIGASVFSSSINILTIMAHNPNFINFFKNKFFDDSLFHSTVLYSSFFMFNFLFGYYFGDFLVDFLEHPNQFYYLSKSFIFKDDDSLRNIDEDTLVHKSYEVASLYFGRGKYDEALSIFFNSFYRGKRVQADYVAPFVLTNALLLDKKYTSKELLTFSLFNKFPDVFIDGVVKKVVEDSIKSNDVSALALSGFYLEDKNDPYAKRVWESLGSVLNSSQKDLESRLFAQGTSDVMSIALTDSKIDIIKSLLLRKQKPISEGVLDNFNDEKILNNLTYETFSSDSSLKIPRILYVGALDSSVYSLIRLDNSDSLFSFVKNNPDSFSDVLKNLEVQTKKIKGVYSDAFNNNLVEFKEVDYSSRILRQKEFFGKNNFDETLARDLLDRLNIGQQDFDILEPSIDNLPEQWLYNSKFNYFSRLDFENKGLRRSIEDRVNSIFWVYGHLSDDLLLNSLNFQLNEFSNQHNVDKKYASGYFLNALFERRNHLVMNWLQKSSTINNIPNLLKIVNLASYSLSKFVDDPSYLSLQKDQTNDLYAVFNKFI